MSKAPPVKYRRAASDLELDRLLERARRGDADAWAGLVERLQGIVYAVPRRYHLGEEDVADVFMTCFQALHRNLDQVSSGWALPRWLATAAARESLRIVRIRDQVTTAVPLDDLIQNEDRSAEAEAVRADDIRRVREGLARLAPRCRDLLSVLYQEEPMPYAEIATHLGLPLGAIGPNRARCLERLRKIMEEEGFFL